MLNSVNYVHFYGLYGQIENLKFQERKLKWFPYFWLKTKVISLFLIENSKRQYYTTSTE